LLFAGCGEGVELGAAVVFRLSPLGLDEALVLHAIKGDVERSLGNLKAPTGDLLDSEQDAIAVERTEGDGFENEDLESSLKQVDLFATHLPLSYFR
jgi:hypothetical protein